MRRCLRVAAPEKKQLSMLGDIGMQMEIGGSEVARRAADLSDSPRWPRGIPWCLFLDSAPTYVGDLRTALISIQKRM
jgi:hypothetical protein